MKGRMLKAILAAVVAVVLLSSLAISVAAAGNGSVNRNVVPIQASGLSEEEVNWLLFMREEEKLARDVYLELYDIWQSPVFQNIAASEQRHMDSVENLLDRYGLDDPVNNEEIRGDFVNGELDEMYQALIEKGSLSLVDAYEVGVLIEKTDIADLEKALNVTVRTDLERVYTNLLRGSNNHLAAFNSHIE